MKFSDASLRHICGDDNAPTEVRSIALEVLELRALVAGEVTDADRAARIRTISGWLHPFDPQPGEITIRAIARGLAGQIRYKNQTLKPYTVAEHSVLVSLLVPSEFAREALLHDASEAFFGDMSAPLKKTPAMAPFRAMEDRFQAQIYAAFGVAPTAESTATVHAADQRICADEMPQLLVNPNLDDYMTAVRARCGRPFGVYIPCYGLKQAENLFLARYHDLFGVAP
jgi:hypothetical protein